MVLQMIHYFLREKKEKKKKAKNNNNKSIYSIALLSQENSLFSNLKSSTIQSTKLGIWRTNLHIELVQHKLIFETKSCHLRIKNSNRYKFKAHNQIIKKKKLRKKNKNAEYLSKCANG